MYVNVCESICEFVAAQPLNRGQLPQQQQAFIIKATAAFIVAVESNNNKDIL